MKKLSTIIAGFLLGVVATLSIPYAVADVTNPFAISVSNEVVRTTAEDLRRTYYQLKVIKDTYGGQLNTLFPDGGGDIIDGRDTVQTITANDARKILLFANTYIMAYEAEGLDAMMKPCVRQLEVE